MQVLGEHDNNVKAMLNTFGVALKPSSFKKDVRPLLKEACTAIFGTAAGVVDMMVKNVPSSKAGSAIKVCAAICQQRKRAVLASGTGLSILCFRCATGETMSENTLLPISRPGLLSSCARVSACRLSCEVSQGLRALYLASGMAAAMRMCQLSFHCL